MRDGTENVCQKMRVYEGSMLEEVTAKDGSAPISPLSRIRRRERTHIRERARACRGTSKSVSVTRSGFLPSLPARRWTKALGPSLIPKVRAM